MTVQGQQGTRKRRDGAGSQRAERLAGLAYARAWRERMRAEFDALFAAERRCVACGQPIEAFQ